jgi:hypothetical protein
MGLSDCFIDAASLPEGAYGFAQLMFLFVGYGYILMVSSNMISDGSELLLLVPSLAGIVGSIVLPILGAVPDGAIVLFSGLGPGAQSQLSVGVGALAGSTIMLLTIPWCLSVYAGRVNMKNGSPNYKGRPKLSEENAASLSGAGVVLGHNVHVGGWIMIGTSITYLLLQGPGLFYQNQPLAVVAAHQQYWSLGGLVLCIALFIGYMWYQYQVAMSEDSSNAFNDKKDAVITNSIKDGDITLFGALQPEMIAMHMDDQVDESSNLFQNKRERNIHRLEGILRPFFAKYDRDFSGTLDLDELSILFFDMGEELPPSMLAERFKKFDIDNSGTVDFKEFVKGTFEMMQNCEDFKERALARSQRSASRTAQKVTSEVALDAEDEEEPEMPEDLAELSPDEQQYRVKVRSSYLMALGTALVLLFSDPMVDVLNEIGVRLVCIFEVIVCLSKTVLYCIVLITDLVINIHSYTIWYVCSPSTPSTLLSCWPPWRPTPPS